MEDLGDLETPVKPKYYKFSRHKKAQPS